MKTLRNWTVITKPVRKGREGLLSYYQYLKSTTGKHKNQTITELTPRKNVVALIRTGDAFNLLRQLSTGGRPSNYGLSVVFSYPFEVDAKSMRKLFEINMRRFFEYVSKFNRLELSDETIVKLIQDETIAIAHSGFKLDGEPVKDHLHTIIPKHFRIKDGKKIISIDLTHKRYMKAIKAINNASVYEVMRMNVLDYEIQSKTEQKKRKSATEYEVEKRIATKVDEAQLLLDEIHEHIREYKIWANANETHDEAVMKKLNTALTQVKNGNTERAKKTLANFKKKNPSPNSGG